MPLVERIIEEENDSTTYRKNSTPNVLYVPPNKMLRGDKVVQPSSDRQLAELAKLYPDEYGELAAKKKVTPALTSQDNVRMREIMAMPMKDIVKTIQGLDPDGDETLLWQIFEAETESQNRKPIMNALAALGVNEEGSAE